MPIDTSHPLPDFTADPDIIRSLIEGERLSFGHLANPAFATEIACIDPLPHQRIAVYDHMLPQARLRFLLADDAGAGKTIMTGLYIREMLSRRLLKRVLIVPPAGLVGNWQQELRLLFSMPFQIVNGSDAKNANPFIGPQSDRVIVSIDTLAGDRVLARLAEKDVTPYDLVVFDEAHKLSSDRGADYRIRKTGRYRLAEALAGCHSGDRGRRLSWQTHHLLLLTATPHMGKDYPYYALWRLLESEVLTTPEAFDQFPVEQRRRYFIRRTKEEMVRLDGKPLYPKRISDTLGYALSQGEAGEQRLYDETTEYLRYVYNRAKLLNQSAARLAMGVFQRRLASSTYALLCSFDRRIQKLDKLIDDVRSGNLTIEQLLTLQRRIREDDDVFESKSADEESAPGDAEENEVAEDKLLQGVVAASLADLVVEKEYVVKLRRLAEQVHNSGGESKFEKLRDIIVDEKYSQEKFLVFTEHRDTLSYLVRRLSGLGYTGQIAQIHGGMHYTERQEQIEHFRRPITESGMRFMICTDAAAEGVNLQFCWIMINYDIPWNPARLEQRMGRIHRYGQKHDPVIILNLVAPATREGRVLKTLLDKIEKIRRQLDSDKVFDSIGRLFSDISIKSYMERLASGDDIDRVAADLDGRLTQEQVQAIQVQERRLFGDGGDVKKELPRLMENIAHETFFRLLPGYVLRSLPEREAFMRRGYAFQEAELASARAKMSRKARSGNTAASTELTNIKSRQRELSGRFDRALHVIRREPELIVPGRVEFIAHALVVPSTDPAELAWREANVEQIAMDVTKAFEEAEGASVQFVSTPQLARAAGLPDHPGFDILSVRAGNQQRCIEVKGRIDVGEVEITDNEWARACNLGKEYWLYVVYRCGTSSPQLVRVQDPFTNLLVRPFRRTQAVERTIRASVESGGVRIGYAQLMEAAQI